jgi:hypothetical protein
MCSVLYTASLQRLMKHFSNNFESLKDCILKFLLTDNVLQLVISLSIFYSTQCDKMLTDYQLQNNCDFTNISDTDKLKTSSKYQC